MFTFVRANAADFDTQLAGRINSVGVYNGNTGVVYAAVAENGTTLVIISVNEASVTVEAYGTEGETIDTVSVDFKDHARFTLSVTTEPDDFCITAAYPRKTEYYRLINDGFTDTAAPPATHVEILSYGERELTVYPTAESVYDFLNALKEEHIKRLPSDRLNDTDTDELITLIKCCADIPDYEAGRSDKDKLTLNVLYTHRNFMLLTDIDPGSAEGHNGLKLCRESFINDAMYKAFRLKPDRPALNMLTTLGYCANNGYYYYSGGYSIYCNTLINGIARSFYLDDGTLYIIFSDTYIEGANTPIDEYSTATALKDSDGWYLTSIQMNSDFSRLSDDNAMHKSEHGNAVIDTIVRLLPFTVLLFAVAAAGVVIYFLTLKK